MEELSNDSGLKENMSAEVEEDSSDEDLPLLPTANIFIKEEEHDFEIVSISSIDDCEDDEDVNISNDSLSEEVINNEEGSGSQLGFNVWPVNVKLETSDRNRGFDAEEIDCQVSDDSSSLSYDDSSKDTDDVNSSNSNGNYSLNRKKRKKLSKMRKKKKKIETYECEMCGVKFNSTLEIKVHSLTSHNVQLNDNKFMCLLCKKQFTLKSSLTNHMTRTHTEEKSINCIKCNKKFKYRSYLTSKQFFRNTKSSNACFNQENKQFTCFHCVKSKAGV